MKLTRRGFLQSTASASIASAAAPLFARTQQATQRPMASRPNVLYIIMEDIGPQLGCYGEPLVQTPHVDNFASQGIRFTHCYSAAPVCSASRSSLMTGNYQTRIGAHQHRTLLAHKPTLQAPVRHISDWFREAGYFTCNLQPAVHAKGEAGQMNGPLGSGKIDLNFFNPGPEKNKFFDGIDWNQRKDGQPFFAHISILETHKGLGWVRARQQPKSELVNPDHVKLASFYPNTPTARDEYANYLDAIHLSDGYVGELLARLEREGLAHNTVVVLSADHGQCLFRSKEFLYDGGLHIPLMVRFPDGKGAGTVSHDFVSGIDIAPMLLGFAGIQPPAGAMQGRDPFGPTPAREYILAARDRMDTAMDRMRCVRTRKYKYIRNYLPGIAWMQTNPYKEEFYPTWNEVKALAAERPTPLNREQALFAAPEKPIEELFDLEADPDEVHNLARDKKYESTLTEMRSITDKFVAENDALVVYEDPLEVYRAFYRHLPEEAPDTYIYGTASAQGTAKT